MNPYKNLRETAKTHEVLLSISCTGVKFADALTKQNICDHQIQNIYCASQEPDDLSHIACIVKEHQTHFHYCHAFCAKNVPVFFAVIFNRTRL
ncbi:ankyrin repeat and sterile alpha motif domain-containing protein 1B-like [Tachypleus tridentatus]|uniref:ankyrin repeat and sterile alpha motif domain-containing protein 1B-like n=1 Tax=Tachypleus tridentatus TaxID=6853 RepID=UPI003FCF364D